MDDIQHIRCHRDDLRIIWCRLPKHIWDHVDRPWASPPSPWGLLKRFNGDLLGFELLVEFIYKLCDALIADLRHVYKHLLYICNFNCDGGICVILASSTAVVSGGVATGYIIIYTEQVVKDATNFLYTILYIVSLRSAIPWGLHGPEIGLVHQFEIRCPKQPSTYTKTPRSECIVRLSSSISFNKL